MIVVEHGELDVPTSHPNHRFNRMPLDGYTSPRNLRERDLEQHTIGLRCRKPMR